MTNTYTEAIALHSELTGLIAKAAAESRELTEGERNRVLEIQTKSAAIQAAAVDASEGRRAFLAGVEKSDRAGGLVLKTGESFADHFKSNQPEELQNLSLGRYVRGLATGNWRGADLEMKAAMTSVVSSAGGFLVPEVLGTRVIDLARAKSFVMQSGAGVVPMTTSSLDLARVMTDPTVAWTAENATITETDMTFGRVSFQARKMAAICRISNELLEDAMNIDAVIENSLSKVMGLELDRVCLFGTGAGQPLGVYNAAGVSVASIGTPSSYDPFLTALYGIRANNYEANAVFYSPRTAQTLAKMVTGLASDKTKLVPPADYVNLTKYVTTQVADTYGAGAESVAVMGQWDQYLVALRADIRLEISRQAGTAFEKDQTLIRIVWRGDAMPLQTGAFCKMTGINA
jgi:HK97 family phage major capsid protein